MKRYPLVILTWLDHTSSHDWFADIDEMDQVVDVATITSAGFLMKEDEKSYLLCLNACPDNFSCAMRILKATVTGFKEIEGAALTLAE